MKLCTWQVHRLRAENWALRWGLLSGNGERIMGWDLSNFPNPKTKETFDYWRSQVWSFWFTLVVKYPWNLFLENTHTQKYEDLLTFFCQYTWFFQCNASPLRGSKPSTAEWQHLDFAWWVLPLSNPLVVHCTGEELSALDPTGHSLAPLERL